MVSFSVVDVFGPAWMAKIGLYEGIDVLLVLFKDIVVKLSLKLRLGRLTLRIVGMGGIM